MASVASSYSLRRGLPESHPPLDSDLFVEASSGLQNLFPMNSVTFHRLVDDKLTLCFFKIK